MARMQHVDGATGDLAATKGTGRKTVFETILARVKDRGRPETRSNLLRRAHPRDALSRRLLAATLCSTLLWWVPGSPMLGPVAAGPGELSPDGDTPAGSDSLAVAASATSAADVAPVVVKPGVTASVGRALYAAWPDRGRGATVPDESVLDAYHLAVSVAPASCHLDVSMLAAIGQVQSRNLTHLRLDDEHRSRTPLLGPVLNGQGGRARVSDTDRGQWDRHRAWDRGVGPFQFLPSSWRIAGVDMDADGKRDPQDIEDAAGAAMVFLCAGGSDLSTAKGLGSAVRDYNRSASFVRLVRAWKTAFDAEDLTVAESPVLELSAVQYRKVVRGVDVATARTVVAKESEVVPIADEAVQDVVGRPTKQFQAGGTRPGAGTHPSPAAAAASVTVTGGSPSPAAATSAPAGSAAADPSPAGAAAADAPAAAKNPDAQAPAAQDPAPAPNPQPAQDPAPNPAPGPSTPAADPVCTPADTGAATSPVPDPALGATDPGAAPAPGVTQPPVIDPGVAGCPTAPADAPASPPEPAPASVTGPVATDPTTP